MAEILELKSFSRFDQLTLQVNTFLVQWLNHKLEAESVLKTDNGGKIFFYCNFQLSAAVTYFLPQEALSLNLCSTKNKPSWVEILFDILRIQIGINPNISNFCCDFLKNV